MHRKSTTMNNHSIHLLYEFAKSDHVYFIKSYFFSLSWKKLIARSLFHLATPIHPRLFIYATVHINTNHCVNANHAHEVVM